MSEQSELFPRPVGPVGVLQAAARRAVEAADLEERDLAGAQLVIELAAVLDVAVRGPKFYVVAPIAQQYRELLAEYGLTPGSRGGEADDPLDALLRDIAASPG